MITLEHVSKEFVSHGQTVKAVSDVSLEVPAGELHVLIGPSGSGKTTTMRMMNRLEVATAGTITIDGRDISTLDVVELRRGIGYVIQQGGLFPHFTIAANVGIVPRLLGWSRAKRRARAHELLELVGLPPDRFADRYPRELSGGQQQRVGVARALAADPPIVLMDEPFGAVDPITRKQLQRELRRIQAEVRKTIVFVTHDIGEAFLLGDRIVLMADGSIVQNGTPADLLRRPSSEFVTQFIGEDRGLRALQYTVLAELATPAAGQAPADGMVLPGEMSVLDATELMERFPQFTLPEDARGLYQADGGLVDARRANAVHIALARSRGATILDSCPVRAIRPGGESVEIVTDQGTFTAAQVIVAAGAWTNTVLGSLGMTWPLTVTQEQVTYFATPHLREFAPGRFPVWIWRGPQGFYGFPVYGEVATKAGQDAGGDEVTADSRGFERNERTHDRLLEFLGAHIPRFLGPELFTKTCLYTMPPDRHFVLDKVPGFPRITIAVDGGHAFKFASLFGKILSQLALDGRSEYSLEPFRADRPALTDPTFTPFFRNEAVVRQG